MKSECAEEEILEEGVLRKFIHDCGGGNLSRRRTQTRTLGLNESAIPWVRSHSLGDAEDMCKCRWQLDEEVPAAERELWGGLTCG